MIRTALHCQNPAKIWVVVSPNRRQGELEDLARLASSEQLIVRGLQRLVSRNPSCQRVILCFTHNILREVTVEVITLLDR